MSKLSKKFHSQSHGNLLDSNLYHHKKSRVKSFFSFGTLRGSSASASTDVQAEPERTQSFRSFVSQSFIQENNSNAENKQKPKIKQVIENFIDDEEKYCENLEFLYMKMTHLEMEHKFDLEGIFFELKTNVREIFLPGIENDIVSFWQVLHYFSKENSLFDIYKRFLIKHSLLKFYVNNFNVARFEQEDLDHFGLPKYRLLEYIDFLKTVGQYYETHSAVYDKIADNIKHINDMLHFAEEYITSHILCKVIKYEKIHIDKCIKFIDSIVPKMELIPKFKCLIGTMPEIYQNELTLLEDMRECFIKEEEFQVLVLKYLKYQKLFQLYVQNEKRDKTLQSVFSERYQVNENLFTLVTDHLFNMKHIFYSSNSNDSHSDALKDLKHLVLHSLYSIDHLIAVGKIFGANISINTQGDIILRNVLQVKYERDEPFRSMVFLFERSIVFTKEDKIAPNTVGYLFHSSIPIEYLGIECVAKPDHSIKVYHQSRYRKLHFHTLSSCDGNTAEVEVWKNKIMEILYDQIKKLKDEINNV